MKEQTTAFLPALPVLLWWNRWTLVRGSQLFGGFIIKPLTTVLVIAGCVYFNLLSVLTTDLMILYPIIVTCIPAVIGERAK